MDIKSIEKCKEMLRGVLDNPTSFGLETPPSKEVVDAAIKFIGGFHCLSRPASADEHAEFYCLPNGEICFHFLLGPVSITYEIMNDLSIEETVFNNNGFVYSHVK
jgi:hypothetical protein